MHPGHVNRRRAAGSLVIILAALAGLAGCRGPGKDLDVQREIDFGLRSARAGLWNEALYRFERAAVVRPDDASLHNNLAVAYEHEGRYEDAEREYARASALAPENDYIQKNVEAFRAFREGKPVRQDGEHADEKPDEAAPVQAAGAQDPDVS